MLLLQKVDISLILFNSFLQYKVRRRDSAQIRFKFSLEHA